MLPWTRLGEKSSAPEEVMMGTPSRDFMEQFLPKRLERRVDDWFLRIGWGFCGGASVCAGWSEEVVDASLSGGV